MYNVNVEKTEDSKILLKITVSKDVVSNAFKQHYEVVRKEAEVPGFRKGKAPADLLKQKFENKIYDEVLKSLVSEYYINALREKQINPVEHPQLSVKKFADGDELIFTAEFGVKPQVKIESYKGLCVNKKTIEVKKEEIDKAIEYLRQTKAEFSPILEIRPAKEGDFLVVDYTSYVDSKLIEKKENVLLSTKDTAFPKEFIDQLLGANVGEERQVKINLPAKFGNNQLAGKPASFSVKIKEIKKRTLPLLDDEFTKDLGFDSIDKMREAVNQDLKRQKEYQANGDMERQIIEQLLKKASVQVPENILKQQTDSLIQDAKNRFKAAAAEGQKISKVDDETLTKRLKREAERQLKIFFILDKIAEEQNIVVSDKEVDERINIMAAQAKQKPSDLKKKFAEKNIILQLKSQMKDEKTMDFLLKKADVK